MGSEMCIRDRCCVSVDGDIKTYAALVSMNGSAHCWFGDNYLLNALPSFQQPVAVPGCSQQPTSFFGDGANQVHSWHGARACILEVV